MTNFVVGIDGIIVLIYIVISLGVGIHIRKYVRNAKDFILADQSVDLHSGLASLAATEFGIITCMGQAQLGYRYGFSGVTVGILLCFSMVLIGRTGFCIEPLRESGALTLPEFFEKKFTRGVRYASSIAMVIAGLLNMGLFLRSGGDFLVIVVGLAPGLLEITMTILLIIVLIYTMLGGLLSVLVTDYIQFIFMSIGMLVATGFIIYGAGWGNMIGVLTEKYGAGAFNPFVNDELGYQWVLFTGMSVFSTALTFQPVISRSLASKNTAVAKKLYEKMGLFHIVRSLIPALWGIGALVLLAPGVVDKPILAMPTMLATLLPVGVIGLLVASMLAADMSTMSSYLLAWSSLLWNDILIVFHKDKWSDKKAVAANRLLVLAIGIFVLFYGLWYPLKADLWVYLIFVGRISASSALVIFITGCYWKKASTFGAYLSIILGAAGPVIYLIAELIPPLVPYTEMVGPILVGNMSFALALAGMIIGSYAKPNLQNS